jgi:Flp pilus assembly protein TadG
VGRNRHEGHREGGAAAVEMALVLPVLFALVFGIIDMGRVFNAEIQLSQAAREGARIAALGAPTYSAGDAETRAKAAAPGLGTIGATATVCAASAAIGSNGTVTVTYPFTFFLPSLAPKVLTQKAVMRCGG